MDLYKCVQLTVIYGFMFWKKPTSSLRTINGIVKIKIKELENPHIIQHVNDLKTLFLEA